MTNKLFILFSFIIPSQIAISHDMDISPYILETKGQQFLFQQRLFLNYSYISVFNFFSFFKFISVCYILSGFYLNFTELWPWIILIIFLSLKNTMVPYFKELARKEGYFSKY